MIGVGSALVSLFLVFVCYSLTLTAKRADENLLMICEKNQKNEKERGKREMESQRDILRVIEKEIKKGSASVAFAGLGFSEECYHLVDSQAKMNQLLDYFFRNEEYAALADRQVKSNIYAEMGKRLNFRSARSDRDRKNMEVAAKQWIKKKHPTFDGDVYVENIRCFLDISQEELEKRKCTVNEQDTTVLIFSQKHLEALQRCKNTEEELAIINYILFSYCEDYFISPKVEKDILEKLKRLMGKTSSMLSDMPTTIDEQLEAIKKVYNFSERNIVPNLLSKEYAITVEN